MTFKNKKKGYFSSIGFLSMLLIITIIITSFTPIIIIYNYQNASQTVTSNITDPLDFTDQIQQPVLEKKSFFGSIRTDNNPYQNLETIKALPTGNSLIETNFTKIVSWIGLDKLSLAATGNVSIAVIDSGVNPGNPWLPEVAGAFVTVDNVSDTTDNIGHGTMVASIIHKIATGSEIYSIKVTNDTGYSKGEWFTKGIETALSLNVSIIHCSMGSNYLFELSSDLISNITSRNITIVVSAGNYGPYGTSLETPAIFDSTIAVGMTIDDKSVSPYSSAGPRPSGLIGPDVVAPGTNIMSYGLDGIPAVGSGTSFASPFITGIIALMIDEFPNIDPYLLKAALTKSTKILTNELPIYQGNGLVNATGMFELLSSFYHDNTPIVSFVPRYITSESSYYGLRVNGEQARYLIGVYSSHQIQIQEINNSYFDNLSIPITVQTADQLLIGYNRLNLTIALPTSLLMGHYIGNLVFHLDRQGYNFTENITIDITNIYSRGAIVFSQLWDNDTFIPDGPTGKFNLLKYFVSGFGYQSSALIRNNYFFSDYGPVTTAVRPDNRLTEIDLYGIDVLVISDIEFDITSSEISLIQNWVASGKSLLVMSYGSKLINETEYWSNAESVNNLLKPYGIAIDSEPIQNGLTMANSTDNYIKDHELAIGYSGFPLTIDNSKGAEVILESNKQPVAAIWEDSQTNGRVLVIGSDYPLSDLGLLSGENSLNNQQFSLDVFSWLTENQHLKISDLNIPLAKTGETISIQLKVIGYTGASFNATIIEADGNFTQLTFKKSYNIYLTRWTPSKPGKAILVFNLVEAGYAPTNGYYLIDVADNVLDYFGLILFASITIMFLISYFFASKEAKKEENRQLKLQNISRSSYNLSKQKIKHRGLERSTICPRCGTIRYSNKSNFCHKCGYEL